MITYRKGDATNPVETGRLILGHGVNDSGYGSAGIIRTIKEKFPKVYSQYENWFKLGWYYTNKSRILARLGEIQPVQVSDNFWVCNIVSQRGMGNNEYEMIPFRYQSFKEAMYKLNKFTLDYKFDHVILPRIGCGLGGANYNLVEKIINQTISLPVTVYDLPGEKWPNTIYEKEN